MIFAAFRFFKRADLSKKHKALSTRLIIFTHYPKIGQTKTRLIPVLGAEGAADLQRDLTLKTLEWAEKMDAAETTTVEVYCDGGSVEFMHQMYGDKLPFREQTGDGLGQQLEEAFNAAFLSGARRAVAIGTDFPGLSSRLVEYAFGQLDKNDVVIGPATDGGYYLIGMARHIPQLFTDIPWENGDVFWATIRKAEKMRLSIATLEMLRGIDRPEDLDFLNLIERSKHVECGKERISVIIPVSDEDVDLLEKAISSSRKGENIETIIVCTSPSRALRKLARMNVVRLIKAPKGRARQMNAGAAAARGQILLFLHADTRLPRNFDRNVRKIMEKDYVAAGAFRLDIEGATGMLGWVAGLANLRARFLHMPYGDQAIFVRAETFQKLGGYPDVPILEDLEFMRLARQAGRVEISQSAVVASARRWRRLGMWRTIMINQEIMAGYCLGLSKQRLARWYSARSEG